MTAYLPWLLVLACPLMMIFMMRGMGGSNKTPGTGNKYADDGVQRNGYATTDSVHAKPIDDRARIAQLEREVAALRTARKPDTGSNPTSRR